MQSEGRENERVTGANADKRLIFGEEERFSYTHDRQGPHRAAFEGGARHLLLRQHRSKEWKKERIFKLLAEYGKQVVSNLSERLTKRFGAGFDFSSIYQYFKFYRTFPQIVDAVRPELRRMPRPVSGVLQLHAQVLLPD